MLRRGGVAGVVLVACSAVWLWPASAVETRTAQKVSPASRPARATKPAATPQRQSTAAAKPARNPKAVQPKVKAARSGTAAVATTAARSPATTRPAVARDASYLLLDVRSGRVLEERAAETLRPAGSFPQLMVLLLSLEQVALGVLPLDVPVAPGPAVVAGPATAEAAGGAAPATPARGSKSAAAHPTPSPAVRSSRIPLRENETYLFSDLLKAIAVSSADDATVAVAETIAGSAPVSVEVMNARAQRLGMTATTFTDLGTADRAAGVPPSQTSARDLGRLARALLDHDLVVHWTGLTGLPFQDGAIILRNINPMVGAVAGVDGLHVSPGVGVVATAERAGLRLVAVVLGAPVPAEGYALAAQLLERGFAHYELVDVVKAGERVNLTVRVVDGSVGQITPVADRAFSLVRRRGEEPHLDVRYQVPAELPAPVRRNQPVGELIVQQNGAILSVIPLVSPVNVASTGILAAAP